MAYKEKQPLLVVAIDIGTSYSGWACSFKSEFDSDPLRIMAQKWENSTFHSLKAPTCVLIKNDGETVDCFGYDAESEYARIAGDNEQQQWYFFQNFKMALFGKKDPKTMCLEDASRRHLPALKVLSLTINFLKTDLLLNVNRRCCGEIALDDVHWVLTVPAIWNDATIQFMREAANGAGIKDHLLTIALEPVAASLLCRQLAINKQFGEETMSTVFKAGSKYLVLDAGGGTVDVTVHEVTDNGDVRELYQPTGCCSGGNRVDKAFEEFISELVGHDTWNRFNEENMIEHFDLCRSFESRKRTITSGDRTITISIPISLEEIYRKTTCEELRETIRLSKYGQCVRIDKDKLRITCDLMRSFFDNPIHGIVHLVQGVLGFPQVRGCSAILMVGAFSESTIVQKEIRGAFPEMKVIVPDEPGLAVLRGAVIYGHKGGMKCDRAWRKDHQDANASGSYDSDDTRFTTSAKVVKSGVPCTDVFDIQLLLTQRDTERKNEKKTVRDEEEKFAFFKILASPSPTLHSNKNKGFREIGQCPVSIPKTTEKGKRVDVNFTISNSEIEAKFTDQTTGTVIRHQIDLCDL